MGRKALRVLAILALLAYGGYTFFFAPILKERKAVQDMSLQDVALDAIPDGAYRGEFGFGSHLYEVEVIVRGQKIEDIVVLKNRESEHAKKAEGVLDNVIQSQSLQVDAVSGATTTSKALLKAVENALLSVNPQGAPFITGLIFDVEDGRVLVVNGIDSTDIPYDEWFKAGRQAIWLSVTGKTKIIDSRGNNAVPSELQKGRQVVCWVDGPVSESYPEQGGAAKIKLLE